MLLSVKNIYGVVRSKSFQSVIFRYLNASAVYVDSSQKKKQVKKQYAPLSQNELRQPFKGDFIFNLFAGDFDKSIFDYPSGPHSEEIDLLLSHGMEVEKYMRTSSNYSDITRLLRDLNALELFGMSLSQEYGGLGYNEKYSRFIEECMHLNPSIGQFLAYNENFGIRILNKIGSEEQKIKYLPKLATGSSCISFAFLENGPISDLSSITTNVVFNELDNNYIINGNKKYVLNLNVSDLIMVLASGTVMKNNSLYHAIYLFLMDKNTPGITIREVKTKNKHQFNFFEINFKNVVVSKDSLLNDQPDLTYMALKSSLSFNHLSASAACLSIIKKLLQSALDCADSITLQKKPLKENEMVKANFANISACIYILESVLYLVSGRYDQFENPDLFFESCIAKVLAVNSLRSCIQNYINIVGNNYYKSANVVEEAIRFLQYYSVFDDKLVNLQVMIGSAGLTSAANSSEFLRKLVNMSRHPFNYPFKSIKRYFTAEENFMNSIKTEFNLKMEVNYVLSAEADILEKCIVKLFLAYEGHLKNYGSNALKEENPIIVLSDMICNTYALAASLARASQSYCNENENSDFEVNTVKKYAIDVISKMDHQLKTVLRFKQYFAIYEYIALTTFKEKKYPITHPLFRSY